MDLVTLSLCSLVMGTSLNVWTNKRFSTDSDCISISASCWAFWWVVQSCLRMYCPITSPPVWGSLSVWFLQPPTEHLQRRYGTGIEGENDFNFGVRNLHLYPTFEVRPFIPLFSPITKQLKFRVYHVSAIILAPFLELNWSKCRTSFISVLLLFIQFDIAPHMVALFTMQL